MSKVQTEGPQNSPVDVDSAGRTTGLKTLGFLTPQTAAIDAGVLTVDWTAGQKAKVTLDENVTSVVLTPPPGGAAHLVLAVVQDAGGGNTVTGWPAAVIWPGGTEPVISAGSLAKDLIAFYWDGTNYWGVASQDFG